MTISEFVYLLTDERLQKVKLYSLDDDAYVFEGLTDDLPEEYLDEEISSIDTLFEPTDTLTINI